MKRPRVSFVHCIALVLLSAIPALISVPTLQAATPAAGTLTDANPVVTYTGGPYAVSNPTDQANGNSYPTCDPTIPAEQCDMFALTVNVSPSDLGKKQILININWSPVKEADYDVFVYSGPYQNSASNIVASNPSGNDPAVVVLPAQSGTYTIVLDPFNPAGDTFVGTISLVDIPTQQPPPPGAPPRYQMYLAPNSAGGAESSGEPSIGVDWNPDVASLKHGTVNQGGVAFFTSNLTEFRVDFDDCSSPAGSLWENVTSPVETANTLDPIGFCDHFGASPSPGRVFQAQLSGATSLIAYSDLTSGGWPFGTDGNSWTQSSGPPPTAGVDHETLGGGPYSTACTGVCPAHPLYPNAIYYCSQGVAAAFCQRSDDGGSTFGAAVPIYNLSQCSGIHGHLKVAPDGTAYVPNRGCGANQAVAVSTDNGLTWTVRPIPDSTAGNTDPSVGIANDGTVYFGYQDGANHPKIAVSHDQGQTWSTSYDVGAQFGIQSAVFPEVAAGDRDRAAFMFLGTAQAGNYQGPTFTGTWQAYIATTFDGGSTYYVVNATPDNPVQVGAICNAGTTCAGNRNLLDFNDLTIDAEGRAIAALADGCVPGTCSAGSGSGASTSALAMIIRQSGGRRLLSAFDPVEPAAPGAPLLNSAQGTSNGVLLSWNQPDNGGATITGYQIYRGTTSGGETLLTTVSAVKTSYLDTTAQSGVTYYYTVAAVNSVGPGPTCREVMEVQAPPPQSPCASPGLTVVNDPRGDQTGGPANTQLDILSISLGEFFPTADNNKQLYFTMQVENLNAPLQPNSAWTIFFTLPDGTVRYVDMNTNGAGGAVAFEYGHVTTLPNGSLNQVSDGAADPSSNYTASGTITIVMDDSKLNNPNGGAGLIAGNTLVSINGKTQTLVGGGGTGLLVTIDSTVNGAYTLVGNNYCAPLPTISLSCTPNPSYLQQQVTCTSAMGVPSGDPVPTGTASFYDNSSSNLLATESLMSGSAQYQTSALPSGANGLFAVYSGDMWYQSVNSAVYTQTVNPVSTTTAVTSNNNPSQFNQSVTFTATITPAVGGLPVQPTGTVTFKDGSSVLCGGPQGVSGGTATCSTSSLTAGNHSITAVYSGDTNYLGSTSAALTQAVLAMSLSITPYPTNPGTVYLKSQTKLDYTVTNVSKMPITITGVTITPGSADAAAYRYVGFCGKGGGSLKLNPGQKCIIGIEFTADAVGTLTATLNIANSGPVNPQPYNLSEIVIDPVAQFSPNPLNFGNRTVSSRTTMPVMLSNTGETALTIGNVSFGGNNPGDFSQTNNCPSSLPASMSCTFQVTFVPATTGTRTAVLTVTDNVKGNKSTTKVEGVGK